jgi:hypothetical protein
MRPSGTLQAPTTGSLEAMLRETEREEQIAAARRLPKQVNIQLPDAPPVTYEPAKTAATDQSTEVAGTKTEAATSAPAGNSAAVNNGTSTSPATAAQSTRTEVALQNDAVPQPKAAAMNTSPPVLAPQKTDVASAVKNLVSSQDVSTTGLSAKQDVTVAPPETAPKNDPAMPAPKAIEPVPNLIELSLTADQPEIKVGEKRQIALQVKSDAPLGLAVITLRFDPSVLKISGVSAGNLFANAKTPPTLTQSIDEHGMVLLSITPGAGSPVTADGSLLNLEVEGVAAGDSSLVFDLSNVHLVASDGRTLTVQIEPVKLTVK